MDSANPQRQQAWSRYWASGALHSCAGSYDGNYGGAIAAFWTQQFSTLTAQMQVLDVGTGNGPLPALMLQACGAGGLPDVDAVDLAQPQPSWLHGLDQKLRCKLRFHANIAIESLPFEDARFDRVYSQYAFEYARADAALDEVLRVLRKGGEVAMLLHHSDSRLAQVAAEEANHIEWLLHRSELIPALKALLPFAALAGSPEGVARLRGDAGANRQRQMFNELMQQLEQRAEKSLAPDIVIDTAQALIQRVQQAPSLGLEQSLLDTDSWCAELADAQLRSQELVEHALDELAMRSLVERFTARGFRVERAPIHDAGWLVGWTLLAR